MLDRDQVATLTVLGFLFRRLGRPDKAGRLYGALLAFNPKDRDVLAPAAAAALDDGRPEEALALLDQLDVADEALKPILSLLRAQALSRLDRPEEASAAALAYLDGLKKLQETS
jgi:tetratricopeptide (TPR) repeat protein